MARKSNVFSSKYKLYLPTEEELIEEVDRQKTLYHMMKTSDHGKTGFEEGSVFGALEAEAEEINAALRRY